MTNIDPRARHRAIVEQVQARLPTGARLVLVDAPARYELVHVDVPQTVVMTTARGTLTVDDLGDQHWLPLACDLTATPAEVRLTDDGFLLGMRGAWLRYRYLEAGGNDP